MARRLHTGGSPAVPAPAPRRHAAARHRDFRNLWIGQAVSTLGGAIGTVAVRTRSTSSPARPRSSGCSGSPRSCRCSSSRWSAARSPTRSTGDGAAAHRDGMALVTALSSRTRCCRTRRCGRSSRCRRSRSPSSASAAGDELARAAARAGRRDRGRGALDSVYSSLGAVGGPGGRRRADRRRRRSLDLRDRPRHVRRLARRHPGAAEAAAARRGRPAEPPLDRRRLPLPRAGRCSSGSSPSTRTRWSSGCRGRSSRRSRCTGSAATPRRSAICTRRPTPARSSARSPPAGSRMSAARDSR